MSRVVMPQILWTRSFLQNKDSVTRIPAFKTTKVPSFKQTRQIYVVGRKRIESVI